MLPLALALIFPLATQPDVNLYRPEIATELWSNSNARCAAAGMPSIVSVRTVAWARVETYLTNAVVVTNSVTNTIALTNYTQVVTTNAMTNLLAGAFTRVVNIGETNYAVTGIVAVGRGLLDQVDTGIAAAAPRYAIRSKARPPDVSFDNWFSLTNPIPDDFPLLTNRSALLYHSGIGTNLDVATNSHGIYQAGHAYWTKYTNDVPAPIIEQWVYSAARQASWQATGLMWRSTLRRTDTPDLGYDTLPIGVRTNNYPLFTYLPAYRGTNALGATNGYERTASIAILNHVALYWHTNNAVRTNGTPWTIALTQTNTRSPRAWLKLASFGLYSTNGGEWSISAPDAQTNDRIVLWWTNGVRAFSGPRTFTDPPWPPYQWDAVLRRQALDDRYTAMTNLVLVPWSNWQWTNSQYYAFATNLSDTLAWYGSNTVDKTGSVAQLDDCAYPDTAIDWWDTCGELSYVPPYTFPEIAPITGYPTNSSPPAASFSVNLSAWLGLSGVARWSGINPDIASGTWARGYADYMAVSGACVQSEMAVAGLWTGAWKRVHVYGKGGWVAPYTQKWARIYLGEWQAPAVSNITVGPIGPALLTNLPPVEFQCAESCQGIFEGLYGNWYTTTAYNVPVYEIAPLFSNSATFTTYTSDTATAHCTLEGEETNYPTETLYSHYADYSATLVGYATNQIGWTNINVWTNDCGSYDWFTQVVWTAAVSSNEAAPPYQPDPWGYASDTPTQITEHNAATNPCGDAYTLDEIWYYQYDRDMTNADLYILQPQGTALPDPHLPIYCGEYQVGRQWSVTKSAVTQQTYSLGLDAKVLIEWDFERNP